VANGQWNYRILDMQKELAAITGQCMGIRLPICTREGDKFDVKFVAAFATKEAAENFDIEAFETYLASITTPEPTEDNTKTPGTLRRWKKLFRSMGYSSFCCCCNYCRSWCNSTLQIPGKEIIVFMVYML
jgi:hypothetical protein